MMKTPPFKITPAILHMSQAISRELGIIAGQRIADTPLYLRRSNSIKTIQASLAIEGNTLGVDHVTDILEGRGIVGPFKDIIEVKNAISLYGKLESLNPLKSKDLLKAHRILMNALIPDNGQWRAGGVGICKGPEVIHVAPPPKRVPELMENLFHFLDHHKELPWLLKACIFHYELEFIHPFSDGNGRMGRLWQQLILMKEDKVFEFIPVEVLIKEHQDQYYKALAASDTLGESTPFLEFSLGIIYQSLVEYSKTTRPLPQDAASRLQEAKEYFKATCFSRKDYRMLHKMISTATASRDLLEGIKMGLLMSQGQKNQTVYQFKS